MKDDVETRPSLSHKQLKVNAETELIRRVTPRLVRMIYPTGDCKIYSDRTQGSSRRFGRSTYKLDIYFRINS